MQCWMIDMDIIYLKIYVTLACLTVLIIPTGIISTCYAIIIITIWTKSNEVAFHHAKKSSSNGRLGNNYKYGQTINMCNCFRF